MTVVLSIHLSEVLGDIILENQGAFVVEILDVALIANIVVDDVRK